MDANLARDGHVSQRIGEENELLLRLLLDPNHSVDDHHLRLQIHAVSTGLEYPSCNLFFVPLLQMASFGRLTVRQRELEIYFTEIIC